MSKIKWIKVAIDMFDDEKIKIIDAMDESDTIHYIWIRLLIQAGKTNSAGNIFLNENIPYTKEMLSIIFNRPIRLIELSLKILCDLKMIDIDDNNFIKILNWEKHQNVEGMEKIREQTRKRVEKHREKKKLVENATVESRNAVDENIALSSYVDTEIKNNYVYDNTVSNKYVYIENNESVEDCNKDGINEFKYETSDEVKDESLKNCNVTVTQQKKKESKKENKNKSKIESKEENRSKNKSNYKDIKVNGDVGEVIGENDVLRYIKNLPIKIIGSSVSAIKLAVSIYGGANVKLAIEQALEVNKPRMNYINGILQNWKSEGYPSSNNYTNKFKNKKPLSFNNFEPREYDYNILEKALLGW